MKQFQRGGWPTFAVQRASASPFGWQQGGSFARAHIRMEPRKRGLRHPRFSLVAESYTRRVVIAGALAGMLCARPLRAAPSDYSWHPAGIPSDAKVSFADRQGQIMTLAGFRGRPVLLHIWATWCMPCIIEIPALDRLQRDLKDRLSVIALSVDRAGMSAVLPALRRLSVRYLDAYVDVDGTVISQLKIAGFPATVVISAMGNFLYVRRGRVNWDDPGERDRLRAILKV